MTLASMKFSEANFVQQWPLRLFRAVFRIHEFVIDNNYPFTLRRGPILCCALRSQRLNSVDVTRHLKDLFAQFGENNVNQLRQFLL